MEDEHRKREVVHWKKKEMKEQTNRELRKNNENRKKIKTKKE